MKLVQKYQTGKPLNKWNKLPNYSNAYRGRGSVTGDSLSLQNPTIYDPYLYGTPDTVVTVRNFGQDPDGRIPYEYHLNGPKSYGVRRGEVQDYYTDPNLLPSRVQDIRNAINNGGVKPRKTWSLFNW